MSPNVTYALTEAHRWRELKFEIRQLAANLTSHRICTLNIFVETLLCIVLSGEEIVQSICIIRGSEFDKFTLKVDRCVKTP